MPRAARAPAPAGSHPSCDETVHRAEGNRSAKRGGRQLQPNSGAVEHVFNPSTGRDPEDNYSSRLAAATS